MINLRVMSNVVYFVGRAISGEDGAISPRSALHLPSICPAHISDSLLGSPRLAQTSKS